VAERAHKRAERRGCCRVQCCGTVATMESGTDTCRERLSVRMVVSSGVASVGTLRAGTAVDGSGTLRDGAGCCGGRVVESAGGQFLDRDSRC